MQYVLIGWMNSFRRLVENHENEAQLPDLAILQGVRVKRKAKVLSSASQDNPEACGSTPASSQADVARTPPAVIRRYQKSLLRKKN